MRQQQDAWFLSGQQAVSKATRERTVPGPARNIILFIGDGMGPATVAAARILEGQQRGERGEENLLSFERLPYVAVAKTYNTDFQTPDSAGTATAILSGVKTRRGVIGVSADVEFGNCQSGIDHVVESFPEIADDAGWLTGLVTTSRITDATPAAAYGHAATDQWEVDTDLPPEAVAAGCSDFAAQLVASKHGNGLDLVFGGGAAYFLPSGGTSPEGRIQGKRSDSRNIADEWRSRSPRATVVWTTAGLRDAPPDALPLLGLFNASYMSFEHDRPMTTPPEPRLSEMTASAIERLSASGKRYFLLVEGGRIDQAHHVNNAARALTETIEFANAVQLALDRTDRSETLVIVTADHDQAMVLAGSASRGHPILGKADKSIGQDGKPYTTIFYTAGPSGDGPMAGPESRRVDDQGQRSDPSAIDTTDPNYRQYSIVPMPFSEHGPGDVIIYASGPDAQLFRGVVEQNYVFHVMMHAARLPQR